MDKIYYYQSLRIFISSPNDVKKERKIANKVISNIDEKVREILGIHADCLKWENLPHGTNAYNQGRIQESINEVIKSCHIFVLILDKKYGSTEKGFSKSNTEREIDVAIDTLNKEKKITLLCYFKNNPKNKDAGNEEKKVSKLRKRLEKDKIWYSTYDSPKDFSEKLTNDLYETILRFRFSTSKQKALRAFWQLGLGENQKSPKISIIYPPLSRSSMKMESPDRIWFERLVPNLVFEDYKAMQKMERALQLIGVSEIMTYSVSDYPNEVHDMNRIWLCLPRNIPAIEQIEKYKKLRSFEFIPRKSNSEAYIIWKRKNNSKITVRSPLSKYLSIQRALNPGGEWKPEYENIVAKDYAIISRFTDIGSRCAQMSGSYKDFFVAGIRGLGTWGAGWFIDKEYETFLKFKNKEDQPIQLLLEVTYSSGSINSVVDVSEKDQEYFDQQYDEAIIQENIEKIMPHKLAP